MFNSNVLVKSMTYWVGAVRRYKRYRYSYRNDKKINSNLW